MAILELQKQCDRHESLLYRENGRPSLVTRVTQLETAMREIKWVGRTLVVLALGILAKQMFGH